MERPILEMRRKQKKLKGTVIVDDTGSVPVGSPKANLKRFTKKAKIVKNFVQDAALTPPASAPAAKSLVETQSQDCPACTKGEIRQDHLVIINPVSTPNPHEAGIRQEQHNAINYLIKPVQHSLSIKQTHLDQAHEALKDAEGAHERFQEFKEQAQNTPLVPQP